MYRIWITTSTELKRIWYNKREMLIHLFGAPVVLAIIIGFAAYQSPQETKVVVFINKVSTEAHTENENIRHLIYTIDSSRTFSVAEVSTLGEGLQRLNDGNARALITLNEGLSGLETVDVLIDVTEPLIQQSVYTELSKILEDYSQELSSQPMNIEKSPPEENAETILPFQVSWRSNEHVHIKFFDYYASGLIVLIVLGLSVMHSSTAITRDRSTGTIERVFATPYGKLEVVTGKLLALGFFSTIAASLCVITMALVHDIALGNVFLAVLTAALVGLNGVMIGLLLSCITRTEAESLLLAIITFLGILALATWIWPSESMHPVARCISQAIPITYAINAMRQLNLLGSGFFDIWPNLIILAGAVPILGVTATLLLKRKIT